MSCGLNPEKPQLSACGLDFGAFRADRFHLYLSANGKYTQLAEFPHRSVAVQVRVITPAEPQMLLTESL